MPTISMWMSKGDDEVGHVSLKTNEYYISFWPKTDDHQIIINFHGVEGHLVLNQNTDRENEYDRDPIEYSMSATVSNEDINSVYEEFLRYNGINPQDVTIERGEKLYKKRQEHEKLLPKEAENGEEPVKLLSKTKYSYSAELVNGKEDLPFYHKPQSCVSLIFNIIQTVWRKRHPDQPIPIPSISSAEGITSLQSHKCIPRVPWIEQVVRKHLVTRHLIIPVDQIDRHKKIRLFLIPFAAILFYFFCICVIFILFWNVLSLFVKIPSII